MKPFRFSFIIRECLYLSGKTKGPKGNYLKQKDILMLKMYLRPETEAVSLVFDQSFLQSGGDTNGTGQGSDMDDPDDTQNPF